jgi:hypothetical protein
MNTGVTGIALAAIIAGEEFGPLDAKSVATVIAGALHFHNDVSFLVTLLLGGLVYISLAIKELQKLHR